MLKEPCCSDCGSIVVSWGENVRFAQDDTTPIDDLVGTGVARGRRYGYGTLGAPCGLMPRAAVVRAGAAMSFPTVSKRQYATGRKRRDAKLAARKVARQIEAMLKGKKP